MAGKFWLFKTEPDVYSYDDLVRDGVAEWDGVRNFQVRNWLRDEIKEGDLVLFYHSRTAPMGVVGVARVVKEGYPDHTAWDPSSEHPDPKSTPERPLWYMVDNGFVERFPAVVSLETLKTARGLEQMVVTQKGSRLSVQPVTKGEYDIVCRLGRKLR
jgi:predicted RNA-binding protein with PUA-like domain